MLEPEQNVFLQHKPYVTQPFDFKVPAQRVIVFIVGGATYVEARELESLKNVILGSTSLLNSK